MNQSQVTELKKAICFSVDRNGKELLRVSHQIHSNPELAFKEFDASRTLCDLLEGRGIPATKKVFGLDTAFQASFEVTGSKPHVSLLAEYDALPDIGHACGHNIIAAASLGAFIALHENRDHLRGSVRLLGTPAEEGGGGKGIMAENGAFRETDVAMMIHPAGANLLSMRAICRSRVKIEYFGKASHASAAAHLGINALDGLLVGLHGISALRQHLKPVERIHGIITDGGQAPNMIPDYAAADLYVRAENEQALSRLKKRAAACFSAGAQASGARVELSWNPVDYLQLDPSWPLADRFQTNAETLGRSFFPFKDLPADTSGSTDMGNVSQLIPVIHPMIYTAPPHVALHSREFASYAASQEGDLAVLDGAKALAMTAADFLLDENLREECRFSFQKLADPGTAPVSVTV